MSFKNIAKSILAVSSIAIGVTMMTPAAPAMAANEPEADLSTYATWVPGVDESCFYGASHKLPSKYFDYVLENQTKPGLLTDYLDTETTTNENEVTIFRDRLLDNSNRSGNVPDTYLSYVRLPDIKYDDPNVDVELTATVGAGGAVTSYSLTSLETGEAFIPTVYNLSLDLNNYSQFSNMGFNSFIKEGFNDSNCSSVLTSSREASFPTTSGLRWDNYHAGANQKSPIFSGSANAPTPSNFANENLNSVGDKNVQMEVTSSPNIVEVSVSYTASFMQYIEENELSETMRSICSDVVIDPNQYIEWGYGQAYVDDCTMRMNYMDKPLIDYANEVMLKNKIVPGLTARLAAFKPVYTGSILHDSAFADLPSYHAWLKTNFNSPNPSWETQYYNAALNSSGGVVIQRISSLSTNTWDGENDMATSPLVPDPDSTVPSTPSNPEEPEFVVITEAFKDGESNHQSTYPN